MEVVLHELEIRMKATKDTSEYVRFNAMHQYIVEGKKGQEIANTLKLSVGTIYMWAYKYKKFGIGALESKQLGGRRWAYMSLEEEKQLLDELNDDALNGLVVVTKIIREKAEQKLGHPVSADYAEDLLHRHEWRKVKPRTKHPKSSKEEQEEFKKKHQNSLLK
jgi:transposase